MRPQTRSTFILAAAIAVAGLLVYVATLRRVGDSCAQSATLACGLTLMAYLPPLWFSRWISRSAVRPLAISLWRIGVLLPVLMAATQLRGDQRNCFLYVLLACYFVALPLESWLLIREANRIDSST